MECHHALEPRLEYMRECSMMTTVYLPIIYPTPRWMKINQPVLLLTTLKQCTTMPSRVRCLVYIGRRSYICHGASKLERLSLPSAAKSKRVQQPKMRRVACFTQIMCSCQFSCNTVPSTSDCQIWPSQWSNLM